VAEAGTHYLKIAGYPGSPEAVGYDLVVGEPGCTSDFDCTDPAAPVCGLDLGCTTGPASCTGDDPAEPDDGPAAARDLTAAVGETATLSGSVCNLPESEVDWYRVTVADGEGLTLDLDSTSSATLDVTVFDATGAFVGGSFYTDPNVVALAILPAGSYYARVEVWGLIDAAAVPYAISATRSAATTCASAADCAATYDTAAYRGDCSGGVCRFLAGAGAAQLGDACDSSDDCASGSCSYQWFQQHAEQSVCTIACSDSGDCAALGPDFACSPNFGLCRPTCDSDLSCGAIVSSGAIDAGSAWGHFSCDLQSGGCG
jgi:hypothetical protein